MGLLNKIKADEHQFYLDMKPAEAKTHFISVFSSKKNDLEIKGEFSSENNFSVFNQPSRASGSARISGQLLRSGDFVCVSLKVHSSFRLLLFVMACFLAGTAFITFSAIDSKIDIFRIIVAAIFMLAIPIGLINLNQLLKNELTYIFFKTFQLRKNPPSKNNQNGI